MPLTRSQQRKVAELQELSKIAGIDFWKVEEWDDASSTKTYALELARDRIIRGEVVHSYVVIEEWLANVICQHFFRSNLTLSRPWGKEWKEDRFRNFNYHVLEGMSLLRKLALVKEFVHVPAEVEDKISRINAIRNALAHSLFPMNKRDFRKTGVATYKGKDIFSLEGVRAFHADVVEASSFLVKAAHAEPKSP